MHTVSIGVSGCKFGYSWVSVKRASKEELFVKASNLIFKLHLGVALKTWAVSQTATWHPGADSQSLSEGVHLLHLYS